jgi:hypothetical protein
MKRFAFCLILLFLFPSIAGAQEIAKACERMKEFMKVLGGSYLPNETLDMINKEIAKDEKALEILRLWNGTTLSIELKLERDICMQLSFETRDEKVNWVYFGLNPGAGSSMENALISIELSWIQPLITSWKDFFKAGGGILQGIGLAVRTFLSLIWASLTGKIAMVPFWMIFKVMSTLQLVSQVTVGEGIVQAVNLTAVSG